MTQRFAAHALLYVGTAAAAAALAATVPAGANELGWYGAAAIVGLVAGLLGRPPWGLLMVWLGTTTGVLVEVNWRLGSSAQAWNEFFERLPVYLLSLAVASAAYLVVRLLLLWIRRRPQGRNATT